MDCKRAWRVIATADVGDLNTGIHVCNTHGFAVTQKLPG